LHSGKKKFILQKAKAHPQKITDGLELLSNPAIFYGIERSNANNLLAFGTALDKSSHAGFAAGEVGLAATALDDLVVLLTHDEPTFSFVYV